LRIPIIDDFIDWTEMFKEPIKRKWLAVLFNGFLGFYSLAWAFIVTYDVIIHGLTIGRTLSFAGIWFVAILLLRMTWKIVTYKNIEA